jgi:hypothetical protein
MQFALLSEKGAKNVFDHKGWDGISPERVVSDIK